jgi:hypothetical protein
MGCCEANKVDYAFGLARNQRRREIIGKQMQQAQPLYQSTGKAARVFAEFDYSTRKSWSRSRRVMARQSISTRTNPRFMVTSLPTEQWAAQHLDENFTAHEARGRTASRNRCVCSPVGSPQQR